MSKVLNTLSTDELDRRLIALLRKDARLPIVKLAKSLGISRTSTYARLQKLQKSGVIEGFTVRVSSASTRDQIRAHVLIKVKGRLNRSTEKQLQLIPEITALHAISGVYDLIAELEVADALRLNELIDQIGEMEGVEETTSSIVLATKWSRRDRD
jgi:DNA-binding Lrp family transcriptional regulator